MSNLVLAFRHTPIEHLGWIAASLDAAQLPWRYVDLFQEDSPLPALDVVGGLIFLGGPMSANDDLAYLRREIAIIERAVARKKPVLGVCLGAQLIAKALGARVYPNRVKEIGWFPVTWTEAAYQDCLFAGLRGSDTVFHWHGETFDLPVGATRLAESEACQNQAFRFGIGVYGLQFHLEVTPEMIAEWCAADAQCGDARELAAPVDPRHNAARLQELSSLIFGRWIDVVQDHG
jgi:GMP synthase (glutamine-hydrolysing)